MRTPIHNIAPSGEPTDDEVKNAAKQLGEAIRNMILPKLDAVSNGVARRPAARPPLALPAGGNGIGGERRMANGKTDRGYIAPPGDEEDVGDIMPTRNSRFTPPAANARKPLALKADRGFIAPEGD